MDRGHIFQHTVADLDAVNMGLYVFGANVCLFLHDLKPCIVGR